MAPLPYWQKYDSANRMGIYETAYIMGMWGFLDYLRTQHPNLLIDNCASGGRRLDYEMMRRSVCFWRSDAPWDSETEQSQTFALSIWLPFTGKGITNPNKTGYAARSAMGPTFIECRNWNSADEDLISAMVSTSTEYDIIRDYYDDSNYYPLSSWAAASNDNAWLAWQFNAWDASQGIVQIYRRPSETTVGSTNTFYLRGLDPTGVYTLTNRDDAANPTTHTGHSLMHTGLTVSSSTGGAKIYLYTKN